MNKSDVKRIICSSVIAAATLVPVAVNAQQTHTETWGNGGERSLVYRPGDFDSKLADAATPHW